MTVPSDYSILAEQFETRLRANKSPRTVETYMESVEQFKNYLAGIAEEIELTADITADHVAGWLIALEKAGRKPATRNNRYRGLQAFFVWLKGEKEIDQSPLVNLKAPPAGEPVIDLVPDEDMVKLLATCGKGRDRSFEDVRDEAILRLFRSTGIRRNEMISPRLTDLDMAGRVLHVVGKGDDNGPRYRILPFGPKAALALDRYLRVRSRHPKAKSTDALWIGRLGPLTPSGIKSLVNRRCELAGIPHIHPHQFRHTYSDEWLSKGGEEGDLMTHNGWKTRAMVDRYAKKRKQARAEEAYRRLQPGEDF